MSREPILAWTRFAHAQVLVVGDMMLDRYWLLAAMERTRISPEAPVPVVPR